MLLENKYEVEQTRDGKYIVLYMNFGCSPPPKGDTPEEAVAKFKEYLILNASRVNPVLPPEVADEN